MDIQKVVERTDLSESTIIRLEKLGLFPQRQRLSPRRIAWLETDIENWIKDLALRKPQKGAKHE